MSKFKVGDKVRVQIGYGVGYPLVDGAETTVTSVVDDGFVTVADDPAGGDYNRDVERFELVETKTRTLKGDNKLVFKALSDGMPWSVRELESYIRNHSARQPTAATVTARIRDLRKPIYGGFRIDRIQQGKQHFYKLVQGV